MVKFMRQSVLSPEFKKLYGQPLGHKIKYFWNKGWDEIPEILITLPLGIFGLGALIFSTIVTSKDTREATFRDKIIVYRPDDPRVKTIPSKTNYKLDKPPIWYTYYERTDL